MSRTPHRANRRVAISSGKSNIGTLNDVPAELLVFVLDVGQGESTLVLERVGEVVTFAAVIDGGFPTAGRGVLIRYLQSFGVTRIDLMVCTHFDGDHTRGLTEFLAYHAEQAPSKIDRKIPISNIQIAEEPEGAIKVDRLLVRSNDLGDQKSQTKPDLLGVAERKGVAIVDMKGFVTINTGKGTKIECVGGSSGVVQDENEGSLALIITHAEFRYYTAGDLPSKQEDALALQPVKAMKCGHHGSNGSTSEILLGRLQPEYAFISCGDQGFGHPTYGVLQRLLGTGSPVKHVFLTNCIHNRKVVNLDYAARATEMKKEYETRIQELWPQMPKLPEEYGQEYVKAMESVGKPDTGDPAKNRQAGLYLTAAKLAAEHHLFTAGEKKRATVAGSADQPGTILLRFTKDRCTVGCWDVDAWKWFGADNEDPVEKTLAGIMEDAVAEEGEVKNVASSPVKNAKTGLSAYATHFLDRAEHYDKHRFARLTVSGLREHASGTVFIPFCNRPECTSDDDENDPLIHLECTDCLDDSMYYHADCYNRLAKGKAEKLSADDGSMLEVTIDAKACPLCQFTPKEEAPKALNRGKYEHAKCEICGTADAKVESEGARCSREKTKKRTVAAHPYCWKIFTPKTAFVCLQHRAVASSSSATNNNNNNNSG